MVFFQTTFVVGGNQFSTQEMYSSRTSQRKQPLSLLLKQLPLLFVKITMYYIIRQLSIWNWGWGFKSFGHDASMVNNV